MFVPEVGGTLAIFMYYWLDSEKIIFMHYWLTFGQCYQHTGKKVDVDLTQNGYLSSRNLDYATSHFHHNVGL